MSTPDMTAPDRSTPPDEGAVRDQEDRRVTLGDGSGVQPSRLLRTRVYKRIVTGLGIAEVTLLDVPLDNRAWNKADNAAVERLERMVER